MKPLLLAILIAGLGTAPAATSVHAVNKFAYGANFGWMDWRGDTKSGAVIGEYLCSGYLYAANTGWIHLGGNAPANGIQYQNNSATDYGVNHDGLGNLRGYAYGANNGWINFETSGAPRVDLTTGRFSGHAYSANCGWISLSNTFAQVQTDTIPMGADTDGDSITDAWELTYTNSLTAFTAVSDTDGDGVSDQNEYRADTSPMDAGDFLRITSITHGTPAPADTELFWTSKPTRGYAIQQRPALDNLPAWADFAVLPPGSSTASFLDVGSQNFFRIRAFRPLSP